MTTQITPHELKDLIDRSAVKVVDGSNAPVVPRVIDASWALDGTNMRSLYESDHIPGAQFFDLEAISDHSTALPHMAPSAEAFAHAVGRLGIRADDAVIVYDRQGLFSAARVWWTFRLMGHENVRVLQGGLPAWKAARYSIETHFMTPQVEIYEAQRNDKMIIDMKALKDNLQVPDWKILDARPAARFTGAAPEPRTGLRSGHMPGAVSLPFGALIKDGALRSKTELDTIFADIGITPNTHVVTTCGSGVTAAIISMALAEVGHTRALLYDGSWSEWGQETLDTPVVT